MKILQKKLLNNLSSVKASLNIKKLISALVLTLTMATTFAPAANAAFFGWGASNVAYLTQQMADTVTGNTSDADQSDAPGLDMKAQAATAVSAPVLPKTVAKTVAAPVTVKRTMVVQASAYSSEVAQTDDSPFITARGTYVRDGIVATNFLPFGTRIKIPAIYGDKIFVVEDRMNKRYVTNVDIWMTSRQAALQFGRKNISIEIL